MDRRPRHRRSGRAVRAASRTRTPRAPRGRCVLLRPDIGATLPVFVVDHYEGFETRPPLRRSRPTRSSTRTFGRTSRRCGAAAGSHDSEIAFVGHGIPGAAIGASRPRPRALRREDPRQRPRVRDPAAGALPRAGARRARGGSRGRRPEPRGPGALRRSSCPRCGTWRASSRRGSTSRRSVRALGPRRCGRWPRSWTRTRTPSEGGPSSLDAEVERALDARDRRGDRRAVRARTTRTFRSPTRRLGSARSPRGTSRSSGTSAS